MPLDVDSVDVLQKVKRGVPARFVLVTKGVKIITLLAYRKGSLDTAVQKAKKVGAGDVSFGVVDGSGAALSFKLARADGFEAPPVRDLVVKAYLAESQIDSKPTIEIVDTLPDVVMDDQESPRRPNTPPPPTPHQPPRQQQEPYRTADEWRTILTSIRDTRDERMKKEFITQCAGEIKAEKSRAEGDQALRSDANAYSALEDLLVNTSMALRTLAGLPPTTNTPTSNTTTTTTQPPPRQNTPPQVPPRPQLDPQVVQQQKIERDGRRKAIFQDVQRRVSGTDPFPRPYTKKQLQDILAECETNAESDFGAVAKSMAVVPSDTYEILLAQFSAGKEAAEKYIKEHKDPKLGKLPSRVLKRREYAETFLPQLKEMLQQVQQQEGAGKSLVETYTRLLDAGQEVPGSILDHLQTVKRHWKLSVETKAGLEQLMARVKADDMTRGYQRLQEVENGTDVEKAEHLFSHGCYTRPDGGTSDVRLLRNPNRTVAYAFKGKDGEAGGALNFLKLPNGACTLREDLCSHVTQSIALQTGLDLGFPKSRVAKIGGQTGALIDGIKGKSVDPEERTNVSANRNADPNEVAELDRCLKEIPEKITPQSLQKVVLFSTLLCQWDCKWGNLLVENESNARPLDGGASFPTQATIDEFAGGLEGGWGGIALDVLTQYPPSNVIAEKMGQTLPQANAPMDPEIVQAVLKIKVPDLVNDMKARRDQLVRDNPDLAPPPHNQGLVDDTSLGLVATSIRVTQDLLRANPQMSLKEFSEAYTAWFKDFVAKNKTGAAR
jgi:hypothetical protein